MAEPMSSSDVLRAKAGFGPSALASQEERQSFYDAGLSPLGRGDRERLVEGKGISPMAGQKEKDAFIASEVQAGLRSQIELPESYGGIGERPSGTTRRAIRMREQWDKQYDQYQTGIENQMKQEAYNKAFEKQQRELKLRESDGQREDLKFRLSQDLRAQGIKESGAILSWLNGNATDANGNPVAKPDPRSPNFGVEFANVLSQNPVGAGEIPEIVEIYNKGHQTYMEGYTYQQKLWQEAKDKAEAQTREQAKTTEERKYKEGQSLKDVEQEYAGHLSAFEAFSDMPDSDKALEAKTKLLESAGKLKRVAPKPKSPEERDALEAGSFYVDPTGQIKIKS